MKLTNAARIKSMTDLELGRVLARYYIKGMEDMIKVYNNDPIDHFDDIDRIFVYLQSTSEDSEQREGELK